MVYFMIFMIIGFLFCATAKEPAGIAGDKQLQAFYIYFLLLLVMFWPLYLIFKLIRGIRK